MIDMESEKLLVTPETPEERRQEMYRAFRRSDVKVIEGFLPDPALLQPLRDELFEGSGSTTLKFLHNTTEACQRYLSGVYIKDHFQSKQERDDWEGSMQRRFGDVFTYLYDRSKLKRSFIGQVYAHMEALVSFSSQPECNLRPALRDAIRNLYKRIDDPLLRQYEYMSYEDKLTFVKHTDEIAEAFLKIVTNPESIKDPAIREFD